MTSTSLERIARLAMCFNARKWIAIRTSEDITAAKALCTFLGFPPSASAQDVEF
jgi:hypothetical protein